MKGDRLNVASGSPYEPLIGFSRAVRVGNLVAVSGTAPIGLDGRAVGVGDPAAQTRRCLEIVAEALRRSGCGLKDVVRTRLFLTDIGHWEAVGRAHGEVFGDIRPASTVVQVTRLVDPDWLVEIEADAVVPPAATAAGPA